jgi:hypothetical protein
MRDREYDARLSVGAAAQMPSRGDRTPELQERTDTSIKFGGYIKLDVINDIKGGGFGAGGTNAAFGAIPLRLARSRYADRLSRRGKETGG